MSEYKNSNLSPERIAALEAVPGWVWDSIKEQFRQGLERLQAYVAREGHARVPNNYKDETGFNLWIWAAYQRKNYKKSKLSPDRIEALESLPGWVWDPIMEKFRQGLERLQAYVAREGHAWVPNNYKDETGFNLWIWAAYQRKNYKKSKLSPDRIEALESLPGWVWDRIDEDFREGLQRLKVYVKREGHARVTTRYKDETGFNLGNWVSNRRAAYRKGNLSPDRIKMLELLLGWVWDPMEEDFREGLQRLKVYVKRVGHARMASRYKDETGFRLRTWVDSRRHEYKNGNLSPERIAALEAVPGWVWDQIESNFQEGLQRLRVYVKREGHARVVRGYKDETGFKLGTWASNRRADCRKGNLSPDRIKVLDSLPGWVWDQTKEQFRQGLERLQAYISREGHARVPALYKDETGFRLGNWVHKRRHEYKKNTLSPERIEALEAVPGWTWDSRLSNTRTP